VNTPVDSMTISTPSCFQGNLAGIFLIEHDDLPIVNPEHALAGLGLAGKDAVSGVVAKQVSVGFQVGHVIDGHDVEFFLVPLDHRAHGEATDPTESIDPDPGRHSVRPFEAFVHAAFAEPTMEVLIVSTQVLFPQNRRDLTQPCA